MTKTRTAILALLASGATVAASAPVASAAEVGQLCVANRSFQDTEMYVPKGGLVRILGYSGSDYKVRYTTAGGLQYTGKADRSYVDHCYWQ